MPRRLRPTSLYCHALGSVLVPLNLFGLTEEIDVLGERWRVKQEFHVTAVHAPWVARRAGTSLAAAWAAIAATVEGRRAGPVRVREELRCVRRERERTLIVMVSVDGLGDVYQELSARLGAPLPPPPAHVTLYTRPCGEGIGVHDETDLRDITRRLRPAEQAEVRAAAGLDTVLDL